MSLDINVTFKTGSYGGMPVRVLTFEPSEGQSISASIAGDIPSYEAFLWKVRSACLNIASCIDQKVDNS